MKALLLALALLQPIERLDQSVAATVQAVRSPALETPMRAISELGRPAAFASVAVVLAIDLAGGAGWATTWLAVAALAGTNLVVEVLKRGVGRVRPDGDARRANSSFPSSHAANAFALAWVLSSRWRRGAPFFHVVAAVVALARIYLNRHYLSDVVVGAAIGLLVAWLCARWLPPGRPHRRSSPAA